MSTIVAGYTVLAPSTAPSLAIGIGAGSLGSGTYGYVVTYITGYGETLAGPQASLSVTINQSVAISNIPISPNGNVAARNIYRTTNTSISGPTYYLLVTIHDNTTTTYNDTTADGSLGDQNPPILSTADAVYVVSGWPQFVHSPLYSFTNNIAAATPLTQAAATQLGTNEYNYVTTVAGAGYGVKLPEILSNYIGQRVVVHNGQLANAMNVWPYLGQAINANGVNTINTQYSLAAGTTATFIAVSASGTPTWQLS